MDGILTVLSYLLLSDAFNRELQYSLFGVILMLVLLGTWKKLCLSVILFNRCDSLLFVAISLSIDSISLSINKFDMPSFSSRNSNKANGVICFSLIFEFVLGIL